MKHGQVEMAYSERRSKSRRLALLCLYLGTLVSGIPASLEKSAAEEEHGAEALHSFLTCGSEEPELDDTWRLVFVLSNTKHGP